MANVMKELKAEISRIARSEVNTALKPIKSVNAAQRKYIADLRRQLADLEKENKQLAKQLGNIRSTPVIAEAVAAEEEPSARAWITSAGIRSMRKRLKLSQKAFAQLAGVSLPTVVNWESDKNTGKLNIRKKDVFDRLQQIKGMGIRDVRKELGLEEEK
jgi:DNA-binding transcriptional regulator YiaG